MGTFNQLNAILVLLHNYAFTIGVSVSTLMVSVYAIILTFDDDQSPAGRTERWAKLKRAIIGGVILAGATGIIALATSVGGMLNPPTV